MIFPFPSSPHCAPIRIVFAILLSESWQKISRRRCSRDLPTNHSEFARARKIDICMSEASKKLTSRELRVMRTILLIILVLMLIGSLPAWPYSSGWGYYPGGGLLLLIILILLLWRA